MGLLALGYCKLVTRGAEKATASLGGSGQDGPRWAGTAGNRRDTPWPPAGFPLFRLPCRGSLPGVCFRLTRTWRGLARPAVWPTA